MVRKSGQPAKLKTKEIKDIFDSLDEANAKKFSELLKTFCKNYTHWGPMDNYDESWQEVYEHAIEQYTEYYFDNTRKYNILRFVRLLTVNQVVLRNFHSDLADLYQSTLFNENGNIRNAGYRLLQNMRFGVSIVGDKNKEYTELRRSWVNLFHDLLFTEQEYIAEHKKDLRKSDLHKTWRVHSTDTQDKFLKNIRRGIEMIDRGFYFDQILEEFGVLEVYRTKEGVAAYEDFKKRYGKR